MDNLTAILWLATIKQANEGDKEQQEVLRQEICNKTAPDVFPSSVADRIVYFAISMSSSCTVGSPFSGLNSFS
jgi:hypothetical protein